MGQREQSAVVVEQLDWKARARLVVVGLLLGTVFLVGITLIEPSLLPLAEHGGVCWLTAGLAGVVAVEILRRWWPERLPAWVLGVVQDRA